SVPRATILLGKYIGAFMSLLIPFLAGILLNVIIIAVPGVIPLDGSAWARIGMVVVFSLLYMAGFLSLGIFVSSVTRESATSLIVLLLSWAMLVIVIPGVGGIIASRAVAVPTLGEHNANLRNAWDQTANEYRARHPNAKVFGSGRWSPGENLAGPLDVYEARNDVQNQYRDTMMRQVKVGQNSTRTSPLGLYKHSVEALAGTGISHHESFVNQVQQYREFLRSVLLDKYPLDPHKHHDRDSNFREAMSKVSFELSDISEFHEKPVPIEEGAKAAIWDVFFLFLFALLFFMGSVVAFLKYDVR
ncbi:ABC transporter permease subunit, partial [Candidatus Poribacteria bacterium]